MGADGLARLHGSSCTAGAVARPRAGVVLHALVVLALGLPAGVAGQQAREGGTGAGRIQLVRELAIGTDPSGPEYEFAGIGPAAVSSSGSLFVSVADGGEMPIRKYDELGRYLGRIGRTGSGPGEYRGVEGMAVVGDTLLVVLDRRNGRVTVFDTGGAYRRSFPAVGTHALKEFAAFNDGTIAVRAIVGQAPSGRARAALYGFIRYHLDGEVVDSIRVPSDDMESRVMVVRGLGYRRPFQATTVFALLPRGGIATARSTTYRIQVAPDRGPSYLIERDVQPIPLEGRERREWEGMQAMSSAGERSPLPRHKPFIRDLFADAEGRIWVDLYTEATPRVPEPGPGLARRPEMTMFEHNAYDVFDERGRYLGRVDLPPSSRLLAVRGDRAWVSEEADSGFYVLVRYRLRMPPVR